MTNWGNVSLRLTDGGWLIAVEGIGLGPFEDFFAVDALDAAARQVGFAGYLAAPGASWRAYDALSRARDESLAERVWS